MILRRNLFSFEETLRENDEIQPSAILTYLPQFLLTSAYFVRLSTPKI